MSFLIPILVIWMLPVVVVIARKHQDAMAINALIIGGGIVAMIHVYPGMKGIFFPENVLSWLQLVWAIAMVWSLTFVPTPTNPPSDKELMAMGCHKL
jgi:hypothetical protein